MCLGQGWTENSGPLEQRLAYNMFTRLWPWAPDREGPGCSPSPLRPDRAGEAAMGAERRSRRSRACRQRRSGGGGGRPRVSWSQWESGRKGEDLGWEVRQRAMAFFSKFAGCMHDDLSLLSKQFLTKVSSSANLKKMQEPKKEKHTAGTYACCGEREMKGGREMCGQRVWSLSTGAHLRFSGGTGDDGVTVSRSPVAPCASARPELVSKYTRQTRAKCVGAIRSRNRPGNGGLSTPLRGVPPNFDRSGTWNTVSTHPRQSMAGFATTASTTGLKKCVSRVCCEDGFRRAES